jgi:hypothetical protein
VCVDVVRAGRVSGAWIGDVNVARVCGHEQKGRHALEVDGHEAVRVQVPLGVR